MEAEGLDADLGLDGVPHDVEDELAEGLDAGLGVVGVPVHDAEDGLYWLGAADSELHWVRRSHALPSTSSPHPRTPTGKVLVSR